ncbi:MAG TPA: acyl-CoA dehydrogenase family protein [Acidimicrobiales bacterium]|nr:acyl-CoA dehydrogenase family protein [Acidimicrobiales bacterium]
MSTHLDALRRVVDEVVVPTAAEVDREGTFPEAAVTALGDAGLLGLTTAAEMGGGGKGLRAATEVVEGLAYHCGSTAMVVLMHYAALPVIEGYGPAHVRKAVAAGRHLTTLALSEAGSRSHFWAPLGTATEEDGHVRLDAHKSWVTAATHAHSYVWSSKAMAADGPMTLWLVPSDAEGLSRPDPFDGLGLRGNASMPVHASGVRLPVDAMLGDDGSGLDIGLALVLPPFLVMSAGFSLGIMEAVTAETGAHLSSTRLTHLDQTLVEQPILRHGYASMRVETDRTRAFLLDTLAAVEGGRPDAMLRVLEVKAAAAESAVEVTDQAMKLCGGAAFRKELGIERRFRDARAARVMAPTTDALLDFVGRALSGLPLVEASV